MAKAKKIRKWLEYAYSCYPNAAFWYQFDEKVPILFESLLNKRIDWNRCNLMIEPIDEKYIFHLEIAHYPKYGAQTRELVVMKCSLNHIDGHIGWFNATDKRTIYIMDEIVNEKLVFTLKHFESGDLSRIKTLDDEIPTFTLTTFNGIPVTYESIPHEGYFSFKFKKIIDREQIKEIGAWLLNARDKWNTLNRGLFHSVYYAAKSFFFQDDDPHIVQYYFDFGSADNEAIVFILKELEQQNLELDEIKILGL